MTLLQSLKSSIDERLSAAAEDIFGLVERILTDYVEQVEHQCQILGLVLKPDIQISDVPVCKEEGSSEQQESSLRLVSSEPQPLQIKEEQQVRSSSLVQGEPRIKEEQMEVLPTSEEADGPMLTLLERKARGNTFSDFLPFFMCEEDQQEPPQITARQEELLQSSEEAGGSAGEDHNENGESEPPVSSTSTGHMNTQADVEVCGASQPTRGLQLLSSHCSESDTEDSDDWKQWESALPGAEEVVCPESPSLVQEEPESPQIITEQEEAGGSAVTSGGPAALNTLKSHKTPVEGEKMPLSNTFNKLNKDCRGGDFELMSQDLKSSKQTLSTSTHSVDKQFRCTVCGKMFKQKGSVKKHAIIHTGERPFTCTICGRMFRQKSDMKTHTRIHTGEKRFFCTFCGKGYGQRGDLTIHMRTHTGEKPYTCTVCAKGFGQLGHLKQHMRTHTGEKPFTCKVCGKGCRQIGSLKQHMRTHTGEKPYSCAVCGKAYSHSEKMKAHVRTHTGERPFSCKLCGKTFAQNENLKGHMRIHTGEKPFGCTVCGNVFRQKSNLRRHMRTHAELQKL